MDPESRMGCWGEESEEAASGRGSYEQPESRVGTIGSRRIKWKSEDGC